MSEEITNFQPVNVDRVDVDIDMLKTYLDEENIRPLLSALEGLKEEPGSEVALQKVFTVFSELGFSQGAVLNYATYLKVLLPLYVDPFGDE